jgi:gliding motility-associated transport system permease protein
MSASATLTRRERWSGTRLVARRELAAYFDSNIAYVYTIAFAFLANWIFMNEFFLSGRVEMRRFFDRMPILFAVFLPAVTMRSWAEERKHRTVELLLTLPIVPRQAISGKYLAALGLLGLFLVSSLPIVVMLAVLGHPDYGLLLSGYLGVIAVGALFLAVGMLFSALASDQIVAFVATAIVCIILVLSGDDMVVAVLDGWFPIGLGTVLRDSISVMPRFESFVAGTIDLSAVVYFAGFSLVLLYLTRVVLERNRE